MRFLAWKALVGSCSLAALMAGAGVAQASSGIESPDSGVEQMGRGSAWLARATDPLAAFFNPAAMAFQASGVHIGAQALFGKKCFTRLGPDGKPVSPDAAAGIPAPGSTGDPMLGIPAGPASAEVCGENAFFPNPQLGAVFRITDRFAIGFALTAPHANGKTTWPETLPYKNAFNFDTTQPAPQRYLLTKADSLIVFPTIGFAYSVNDKLAFGASFIWGIAKVEFENFSEAQQDVSDHVASKGGDLRAKLDAKDLFIPGFVLSAMWSPTPYLDLAAAYKWSDAVRASTNLRIEADVWKSGSGAINDKPCINAMGQSLGEGCNVTEEKNAGTLKFSIPMEAKLGIRYHHPRANVEAPSFIAKRPGRYVRDPMSQDLFDIEIDFTWANNSSSDAIELRFREGIPIKSAGQKVGAVPTNADIPHRWRDVVGVRLGGEVVPLQNRLALRAGGFFESKGVDDKYLNVDFNLAMRVGLSAGATVRVGPVDISVGYQHTFFGTLDNKGQGAVHALSGDPTSCPVIEGVKTCNRSNQAVNGGVLKASLDEVGVAGTVRF